MHVANTGSWTLATIIGTAVVVLLVTIVGLGGIGGTVVWARDRKVNRQDAVTGLAVSIGAAVLSAVILLIYVAVMWPLNGAYHQWRSTSGTVESVASRQVANDKAMETKYVIKFVNGGERGCLDTRCALIKPGDQLELKCKKIWQWSATAGFDCNYVSRNGDRGE